LNARIAGAEIEAEALEVARLYSSRKQAVQEQDREIAMARDLLDVLKALGKRDFSPGEIRLRLSAVDSWGSKIEYLGDRAQSMYIAEFLRRYGSNSIRRDGVRGALYSTNDLIEKLEAHLPVQPAPATVDELDTNCFADHRLETDPRDPLA
jgi:hypothetical protein